MRPLAFCTILLFAAPAAVSAQVSLPAIFTDHMVLQRDQPIHVWGTAAPQEAVRVSLHDASASTHANALGQWSIDLAPAPAGGPYTLMVSAANTIALHDVLLGDVWVASGQSNMQFTMQPHLPYFLGVKNYQKEIAEAGHAQLRLFHIKEAHAPAPQTVIPATGPWQVSSPASVVDFSAVGYFFGRDLLEQEKVPVGIIESDVGGTPAEAWTSRDALTADPGLMPVFSAYAHMMDGQTDAVLQQALDEKAAAQAKAAGRQPPPSAWHPDPATWAPSWLYNAMIAPITPLRVRGFLWYQGESNTPAERAPVYAQLFRTMIENWRAQWGEGDLPFLFVQIANYTSGDQWAVVREAQLRALELANTGMAVTVDIGDPANIHPTDKQDVAYRLSLWARNLSYGGHVEDSGPLFREAAPAGPAMRIWFSHVGSGLEAKGGALRSFEVAGADDRFVAATANIEGDTVIAASPAVPQPVAVRYGWSSAPVCNLFNKEGLPASPFTSVH